MWDVNSKVTFEVLLGLLSIFDFFFKAKLLIESVGPGMEKFHDIEVWMLILFK